MFINQKQNKMKTNLENVYKLHFELNLDNFFNVEITENMIRLLGWYDANLEKLLFDKGYQLKWSDEMNNYRFETENLTIVLSNKPIL